jgi:molecular chaperone GrpE
MEEEIKETQQQKEIPQDVNKTKTEIDLLKEQTDKLENASTGSALKDLEEKLVKCEKEREEYLNGWKRAKADYINLKKDEMKRMEEAIRFGNEELIEELLPVLDSFELSIMATKDPDAKNSSTRASTELSRMSSLQEGIKAIYSQLENILNRNGLEKIKALGEKFDTTLHEALMQEESDKESGTILEEMVKGWKLNGKVIRPTKVKISK